MARQDDQKNQTKKIVESVRNRSKKKAEEVEENLNPRQIALLKKNYSTIDRIDPSGPAYKKAKGMIAGLEKDNLIDLAKAKVKFISQMAADELRKTHNVKLKAREYMESVVEEGKGLWHNIRAKRKRGEPKAKPGDKDYPKTLDIESTELDEAKSATGYDLYHKTYSDAMQHAYAHAKKKHGVTVSSDEIDSKVAMGPKKPSTGKTVSHILGTDKKKNLHVQVYNTGKSYELNMYVEGVKMANEGQKPVSQMTPAEKAADAKKRKEYNAYQKSKRNESVELDEAKAQKMDQKMFDSLKKGDRVTVTFGSGIKKDNTKTLQVKSKTKSAKFNLEKINMFNVDNPGGVKYTVFNRKGSFSLAMGDMAVSGGEYVKESLQEKKENPMKMKMRGHAVEIEKTGDSLKPVWILKVDGKEEGKFKSDKDAIKHFSSTFKESVEPVKETAFENIKKILRRHRES